MIDIKNIDGSVIFSVLPDEDALFHEELMTSDYVQLSWDSDVYQVIPAGAYIEYEGEKYKLLDNYTPTQQDECTYQYTPQFQSRIMNWDKQITPVYTYEEDGTTVKSREMDWEFTGSSADAMYIVKQAIKNETGENWTIQLSDSLPATITISSQSASIFATLNTIANECDTEWWADKKTNTLYLSKCIFGDAVKLEVGDNVQVPTVTSDSEGYFTRFYAFGSTRNITQDYNSGQATNSIVNKRLALNPTKYPNGYKDIKSGLKPDEVFVKVLYFDDIYPSSKLTISDVRARLRYRLDNSGQRIIIGGTDEEPVYEQYAIWYFQIAGFTFNPETDVIEGLNLSASFESGQLNSRDFELTYHEKAETVSDSNDVTPFEVKAGDYEIVIDETSGQIIPGTSYIIPQDGDSVVLYNIVMPDEYVTSAQDELEKALDKAMLSYTEDNNTYQMASDPTRFYESGTDIQMGQAVTFVNGSKSLSTRVQMVEKRLDLNCYQTIKVGNKIIKGNTQQLKDEVASVNQNIDVIKAFNDLSTSLSQAYANAQREMIEGFAAIKKLWSLKEDDEGNQYAYTKLPIVGAAGMTLFAGDEIKVDSIFKGLPIDTETLQWVDGVLTVVGGTGGASNWDELEGKPSWITTEKPKYTWSEIEQKPSWITTEKPKYSYTEITGLVEELGKYVTLSTDQSVTGMKDFANGMKVSGVLFKVINGVLTLDCSIAVTGGITAYALGEQTAATIMDGVAVDGITITKEDGVLTVVGGTGGASNWDELEGKPSWITDIKPVYAWGEITQKPTTLSGYGIQASDVLNVLKTVDGSGSGLDADLLDGLDWNSFDLQRTYTINLSSYSSSNFYPVIFNQEYRELNCWIQSPSAAGSAAYNCNRIHFLYSTNGWSDFGNTLTILSRHNYVDTEITIGSIGRGKRGGGCIAVWLRGGLSYTFRCNRTPNLKTSNYTIGEETYTVGTGISGGTNSNVDIIWTNDSNRTKYDLAAISSNVASATKLQTARTIWGQSFDGTANVTGSLTSVTDITGTGTFTGANIKATDSVYVNGIRLHKTVDGAVTIEGNLLVTGGITAYADGEDSGGTGGGVIVIDNLTSTLTDAALSANQGRVLKDLIDSKVSNWGELEGKPTTIAGYGITDAYTKTECDDRYFRYLGGSTGESDTDWQKLGFKNYNQGFPDGLTHKIYGYGQVVTIGNGYWSCLELYSTDIKKSHPDYSKNGLQFRTGWDSNKRSWRMLLDEVNYASYADNRYGVSYATNFNTDPTESDVTSTSITDFLTRINYSGLLNTAFGFARASWYYVGNTQYNTGVGRIEMAGTAILNMSSYTGSTNLEKRKSLLFLEGSTGNLYSFVSQDSTQYWSRYAKTTDNVASATNADMVDNVHLSHIWYYGNTNTYDDQVGSRIIQINNTAITSTHTQWGAIIQWSNTPTVPPSDTGSRSNWYFQLFGSTDSNIYYRQRINGNNWKEWRTIAFTTSNVASATKLQTARTLWGQSFDGTANVSGSLTGVTNITASGSISCGSLRTTDISGNGSSLYIGNSNNSSNVYLREDMKSSNGNWSIPVNGNATFASATINGALTVPYHVDTWISMATRSNVIQANQNQSQSGAHALFRVKSYNGNAVCFGGSGNRVGFYGFTASNISSGTNNVQWKTAWNTENGYLGIGTDTPSVRLHVIGNILATGGGTFYSSDIRAKTIIERPKLSLNSIANSPVIKFRWNGCNGLKDDNKLHVGGIAQYIEKILPECVIGQKDDFLSFDYATVGYIFSVQTARHLQSYETKTDREIRKLKKRIVYMESKLKKLGYEEVDIMAD